MNFADLLKEKLSAATNTRMCAIRTTCGNITNLDGYSDITLKQFNDMSNNRVFEILIVEYSNKTEIISVDQITQILIT